jgi:DNA-binding transcriptional MerR regulator
MGQFSIKEVEVLSGIKAHTLRIWEQRYGLIEPERTDTNIRYYSDKQLKLVLNVSLLNNSGLKISKIADLSPEEIAKEVLKINKPDLLNDRLINRLIEGMISLDKASIVSVLYESKHYPSLVQFFLDVVFPFLSRVGMLWASESINPAQEHFASNIIKRFLIGEIENLDEPSKNAPLFVLFLPEGDWHELSLLVAEYILKKAGKNIMYLGASVPDEDIEKILHLTKIDYLLCVSILSQPIQSIQDIINRFTNIIDSEHLIFGGRSFYHPQLKFPKSSKLLFSFEELSEL